MYKIEKNVVPKTTPWRDELYETITKLQIGDSFLFPTAKFSSFRMLQERVRGTYPKRMYTTRKETEALRRVWRVV